MVAHVEKKDVDAWSVTKKINNSGTKIIKIIATKAKPTKRQLLLPQSLRNQVLLKAFRNDIKKCWHGIKSCFLRYWYMKKSPAEQENIKWTYWLYLSFLRESVTASVSVISRSVTKRYFLLTSRLNWKNSTTE